MTAVQGFTTPHYGTEDAMEVSTEAEPTIDQDDDIDLNIDFAENLREDLTDQDMTEECEDAPLEDDNRVDGNFDGVDALMEEAAGGIAQSPSLSSPDEDIQDLGTAASRYGEDVIVDDLIDESEEGPQHAEGSHKTDFEAVAALLPQQLQGDTGSMKTLDFHPELNAEFQANSRDRKTDQHHVSPFVNAEFQKTSFDHLNEQDVEQVLSDGSEKLDGYTEVLQPLDLETSRPHPTEAFQATSPASPGEEEPDLQSNEYDRTNDDNLSHLHPINIEFQGSEMFLFPPVDKEDEGSPTYLLPDENMATNCVQDILSECRVVLEDNVEEEDELEIAVDELDLRISEVSVST